MIVLVTGASSGFGAAIARKFASEFERGFGAESAGDSVDSIKSAGVAHTLVLTARRKERLEALKKELESSKVRVVAITCDIANTAKIVESLAQNNINGVDILVNNAGLALGLSSAEAAKIEHWEEMIATNITALVRLTHALLPYMVAQRRGHIINIGSIAGRYPYPGGNVYGATKAFVRQFSLNLRADLFDKGVRVTNIEPGLASGSEFSLVRFEGDAARANAVYENTTPLDAADIAQSVFFVASLPAHVNVNTMEIMPTTQAPAALNVAKNR